MIMKDEIKEILDKFLNREIYILQDNSDLPQTINDILLDYITNLQEENEKSFEKGYAEGIIVAELDNENEFIVAYKELKQRIDKAIEYIEKNKQIAMFADLRKEGTHQYTLECDADDLLNILNGGDEE